MSHVNGWPMGRLLNLVIMAWQPTRDRKNRSGWCIGTKVEKFVKDVIETQSCEYGFILSGRIIDIMNLRRQPV